jgi:rod shape-determining protein MreD
MTALFYAICGLVLILLETTILPLVTFLSGSYDLLVPFVVYLGLYRPVGEGLPVVAACGLLVDNLSGGPFGLYLFTYLWLLVGLRWSLQVFRLTNPLVLPLVVMAGVLLEIIVVFGTQAVAARSAVALTDALPRVAGQLFWALVTGPLLVLAFDRFHGLLQSAPEVPAEDL